MTLSLLTSEERSPAVAAAAPAGYIQPTFGHALRVWWALYWRTFAIAVVFIAITTYRLREIYEDTLVSAKVIFWASKLNPYVFFYLVAFFVMRFVLHKRFRHFRIAVWPIGGQPVYDSTKPTLSLTLRVWWAYSWRTVIYSLVGTVVVGFPIGLTLGLFAPPPAVLFLFRLVLSIVVEAGVGLYVIYSKILDEDFAEFHVGLLPIESPVPMDAQPLPPFFS